MFRALQIKRRQHEIQIVGTLHSFKSIDYVTNEDKVTNYSSEF